MTAPMTFDDIDGGPRHDDEVMGAHEGRPTVQQQDRTHGAGSPAEDRGLPDDKYGGMGAVSAA